MLYDTEKNWKIVIKVQKTGRQVACLLSMSACPLRSTILNWTKLFCISYKFSFVYSLFGILLGFYIFLGRGDIVQAKMSNVLKSFGTNIYMLLQNNTLKVQKTWYREEKLYQIETTPLHFIVLYCTVQYHIVMNCTALKCKAMFLPTVKNYSDVGLPQVYVLLDCTAPLWNSLELFPHNITSLHCTVFPKKKIPHTGDTNSLDRCG